MMNRLVYDGGQTTLIGMRTSVPKCQAWAPVGVAGGPRSVTAIWNAVGCHRTVDLERASARARAEEAVVPKLRPLVRNWRAHRGCIWKWGVSFASRWPRRTSLHFSRVLPQLPLLLSATYIILHGVNLSPARPGMTKARRPTARGRSMNRSNACLRNRFEPT
jgi:hypothetical protein